MMCNNDFELIALTGKMGEGKFAIVDSEDFEEINKYKWHLGKQGYAKRTETKTINGEKICKTIWIHKQINQTPAGMVTDHINGNVLDNRKENLRSVEHYVNMHNRGKTVKNKSGFKGVCKNYNKFEAGIRVKGKKIYLGLYDTAIQAALAYNKKAIELFGEYANLNKVEGVIHE